MTGKEDDGAVAAAVPPAASADPMADLREAVRVGLCCDARLTDFPFVVAWIARLVPACPPAAVAALAKETRTTWGLRQVPLLLIRELARTRGNGPIVRHALKDIIDRPEDLTAYVTLYWRDGRAPLSAGSRRGLAAALMTFNAYQLARATCQEEFDHAAVTLVDVLRLVRPRPTTPEHAALLGALLRGRLIEYVKTLEP